MGFVVVFLLFSWRSILWFSARRRRFKFFRYFRGFGGLAYWTTWRWGWGILYMWSTKLGCVCVCGNMCCGFSFFPSPLHHTFKGGSTLLSGRHDYSIPWPSGHPITSACICAPTVDDVDFIEPSQFRCSPHRFWGWLQFGTGYIVRWIFLQTRAVAKSKSVTQVSSHPKLIFIFPSMIPVRWGSTLCGRLSKLLSEVILFHSSLIPGGQRLRLSEITKEFVSTLYNNRLQLHSEYEFLMKCKIELQSQVGKPRFGKPLAHQARCAWASRLIPKIKVSSGDIVADPSLINQTFSEHFANRYASQSLTLNLSDLMIVNILPFPPVLSAFFEEMGSPVSICEVHNAIRALQFGNSPGPDGFRVYNESLITCSLSIHVRCHHFTFDEDPTLCGSYSTGWYCCFKILVKVFTCRLQLALPDLIAQNQAGLLQGSTPPSDSPKVVVSRHRECFWWRWMEIYFLYPSEIWFMPCFCGWHLGTKTSKWVF